MKKSLFTVVLLSSIFTCALGQEKQFTTSDGVSLYVNVRGEGPYCLYLHGGPGSGSLWLERFFGDFLEKRFTMVYLDQRGTGRSSSPADGDYSMERMVCDFEELRESLCVSEWLTLGHSFGGVLQMGYVETFPESHLGMIMINCTLDVEDSILNGWLPKSAELLGDEAKAILQDERRPALERLGYAGGALREKGLDWQIFYADPASKMLSDATFAEIDNFNNDFGDNAMSLDEYWRDYTPNTPCVDLPVLFFYGATDWSVGPRHYRKVAFPNMILWGSDVGHMPFLENRADLEKAITTYSDKYGF